MENENFTLFPDINEIYSEHNQNKLSNAYDLTFDLILNIVCDIEDLRERNKIFSILITLFKNILDHPEEDKFRKIKLSNQNIKRLFEINGVYAFFNYLGFEERFIDRDLFLFLENVKFDSDLIQVILSYMNLLILNEEQEEGTNEYLQNNEGSIEGYPQIENNQNKENNGNLSLPTYEELNSDDKNKSMIDILKETSNYRKNLSTNNANNNINNIWNSNLYNKNKYKKQDIKSILKETAAVRRNNSEYFSSSYNAVPNNNFPSSSNRNNSDNTNRFVTLNDIRYSNPDFNNINKNNFKVNDEIGKKCLQLSNEFRKRNGLAPLEWDDHIWKISYEHSMNMGVYKVKFGHDGFNDRIRKLPFYFHQANENVFMCNGVSEYSVSEMGVNGWINSPGHRKNLLSYTTHCAIATYRNNYGEYFLTQIFIRK